MIKIENVVLASPEQMEFIIQGMRNPMNSWGRSDSRIPECGGNCDNCLDSECQNTPGEMAFILGDNDHDLMRRLAKAGTDHRKFMRMMPVYARITAPLYFWKEYDTYKIGTVANSCSTMHKIQAKEFTLKDFSYEHLFGYADLNWGDTVSLVVLESVIGALNIYRQKYLETGEKIYWWQMIQLLPSSYNQTRNVMMNYEVLANMHKSRKQHKLHEWREFCKWIEELPYSELITGKEVNN